jgi:hypothetical protein
LSNGQCLPCNPGDFCPVGSVVSTNVLTYKNSSRRPSALFRDVIKEEEFESDRWYTNADVWIKVTLGIIGGVLLLTMIGVVLTLFYKKPHLKKYMKWGDVL